MLSLVIGDITVSTGSFSIIKSSRRSLGLDK
jgi:hypothetical protein